MTAAWTGLGTDQHDERDHSSVPVGAFAPDTVDARGAASDGTGAISGGIILARTATDVRNARLGPVGPSGEGGIDAGTTGDTSLFRDAAGRWKTPQRLWVAGLDTADQRTATLGDDIGFAPIAGSSTVGIGASGAAAFELLLVGKNATNLVYLQHDNAAGIATLGTLGSGMKVQSASGLLGFFNATPVARTAGYTQTYSTASRTMPNLTSAAVATTGATAVTPFGYTTAAQADAIVTAINAIRADVDNTRKVVNQILDDLQSYGLLQ